VAIDSGKLAYWSEQFAGWRASGLSRGAFCEREGLKLTTFDYWRARLGTSGESEAKLKPIPKRKPVKAPAKASELTLVAAKRTPGLQAPALIKLRGERWELSLPASIEPTWLIALLRALS
jgi:hypothetical protein